MKHVHVPNLRKINIPHGHHVHQIIKLLERSARSEGSAYPLPEASDSKISLPTTQTSLPQTPPTSPNHVIQTQTMSSFTHATTLLHAHLKTHHKKPSSTATTTTAATSTPLPHTGPNRRNLISTFLATSTAVVAVHGSTQQALAQNWGTRSFIWEHFFGPGLSPEDAVARIKQTAEGLHDMREPLETLSWRYIMFYIRIKQAYLDQDLRTAFSTLPQNRRKDYVRTANELISNFEEFDRYIRTPKVYESYLYYEKTLKSIDELVAILT
ncbi:photosynthetic NDH subunit of lumenal location 2, chloroplastic [Vigna umbellata]|uniref:photosynthetic NDH subunit of lumenal location 2, chloroplastic n=1 Tax=Vigna umbellata TaxID=87088 RepID=UPI001F5E7B03|nr:photosynthetic NDH subunit of lumenal location 2, chloroplastic [Vigna umbellata]